MTVVARRAATRIAAAGLLVAFVAASCSSEPESHDTRAHTDATSLGRPDRVIAGPQGSTPQFVVECGFSHSASDDPIVYPDQPGQSHLHMFFGNTDVDASTTVADLAAGDTTCDDSSDKAAYWAPALLRGPEVLTPTKSVAYYRPGIDVVAQDVQPYPEGLVMIAGNSGARGEQPLSIVAWGCGRGIVREALPPTCAEGNNLELIITFPDCWDGENLDSADHHGHVAYSSGGECPKGYPVHVPQLQFVVEYPVWGDPGGLLLASGGLLTGHADFMNGWDQDVLAREVRLCLHNEVVCGLSSE